MELQGKTALVTSGLTGVGQAICLGLARSGANVAFSHPQSMNEAAPLAAAIRAEGPQALATQVDIADEKAVRAWIAEVIEKFGSTDILINNAGTDRDRTLIRMTRAVWNEVLGVNLNGPFNVTHAVLEHMIGRGWGRIINISPSCGTADSPIPGNQSITKGGLIAFTMTLAREVARRGITVNAIEPGYIETENTSDWTEAERNAIARLIPMGRLARPAEIAEVVTFLASPRASFITGQVIRVNGGMLM